MQSISIQFYMILGTVVHRFQMQKTKQSLLRTKDIFIRCFIEGGIKCSLLLRFKWYFWWIWVRRPVMYFLHIWVCFRQFEIVTYRVWRQEFVAETSNLAMQIAVKYLYALGFLHSNLEVSWLYTKASSHLHNKGAKIYNLDIIKSKIKFLTRQFFISFAKLI